MADDTATDALLERIEAILAPADDPTRHLPTPEAAAGMGPQAAADLAAQAAPELDAFRIDGDRTALWAATRLQRAQARIDEARAVADALRADADAYEARVQAAEERGVRYFTGLLRAYFEERVAGTKKRSHAIPGGHTLKITKGSVTTEVDDEARAELVDWLEDNAPEALEYPDPKPKAATIKERFGAKIGDDAGEYLAVDEATGEVVPGVRFRRKPEKFEVKLAERDEAEDQ